MMNTKLSNQLTCLAVSLLAAFASTTSYATVGQIAADFELPLFDEETTYSETKFKLSDYEGKVIVMEWFGWWCPFCPPAARAFHDQVLSKVGSRNSNGVDVEHVVLHVNGVDNAGIAQFMRDFELDRVVMDDKRDVFRTFHQNSTQPFFVILNAVAGSPTSEQWEVLYEHNGYGGSSFPGNQMVQVINSVEPGSETPGTGGGDNAGGVSIQPTSAPTMAVTQPYSSVAIVDQLKDSASAPAGSAPTGIGMLYDANFPNVYSFSLAQMQRNQLAAMTMEQGSDNSESIGWLYINPEFTDLHGGILAYRYFDGAWIWLASGDQGRIQNLSMPASGEAGWKTLPTEVEIPAVADRSAFISNLAVPTLPESLSNTNPFALVPASGSGQKDVSTSGFHQLGMIDDRAFPIVSSDVISVNQSGDNAGWIYILPQPSSVEKGIMAYLYQINQWVWFPKDSDLWFFAFAFPNAGSSGWKQNAISNPVAPTAAEVSAFESLVKPETATVSALMGGNPFAGIVAEDGVKNTSGLGEFNLGWVDDSQYPFVYSYDLAKSLQGEDAGWLYIADSASSVANGLMVYSYGNTGWHWIPGTMGLDGASVHLSEVQSGISGWNNHGSTGVKPTLQERTAHGADAVPESMPLPATESVFAQINAVNGAKNTQLSKMSNWGLGWIDDRHYPFIYSYDYAREHSVLMTAQEPGWFYVQESVSNATDGVLLFNYTQQKWRWIPANGSGRYFDLSEPVTGDDGWFRFAMRNN